MGELARRIDRLDVEITRRFVDLSRRVDERMVPMQLWQEAHKNLEDRVEFNERRWAQYESWRRAVLLSVLIAVLTSIGSIVTVLVQVHH